MIVSLTRLAALACCPGFLCGLGVLCGLSFAGCLHPNNAPSGEVPLRLSTDSAGYVLSWAAGGAVEIQVGRCTSLCQERSPVDPTSEFSEFVPSPDFTELAWHVRVPAGAAPPLRLFADPAGSTVLVPATMPDLSAGLWAVFVVVESDRGGSVLTQTGVATLN